MNDKTRHEFPIKAGPLPIDTETGLPMCPPPISIEIIKVKKVFNECMHTQVIEVPITSWDTANTTEAAEAECESVEVTTGQCTVLNGDVISIPITIKACAVVPLDDGGFERKCNTVSETKLLSIDRAGEEGLDVQCDCFVECLFCYISERDSTSGGVVTVTCCVGLLVLIKVEAEVQLLVPCYGYPPPPPECGEFLGNCPTEYSPDWPPYPSLGPIRGGTDKKPKGCK